MSKTIKIYTVSSGPTVRHETISEQDAITYAQNVYRRTKAICTIEETTRRTTDWTRVNGVTREAA